MHMVYIFLSPLMLWTEYNLSNIKYKYDIHHVAVAGIKYKIHRRVNCNVTFQK